MGMFYENNHMFVIDNLLYLLLPRKKQKTKLHETTDLRI